MTNDPLPIDLLRLSRTLGVEDEAVMMTFLDIFLEEFPKLSATLQQSLKGRDPIAAHHAAHTAKGAAANAAAPVLTQHLKSIQNDAHKEDWAALEGVFGEIEREHEKIIAYRRTFRT